MKKSKIAVLIVDDHPIMRQGLAQIIDQEPDLYACGEAENSLKALEAITQLQPDVAIVDITLKGRIGGIELIKDIKLRWPTLPVLVLSVHDESVYAERALRAGARGYIMKEEATSRVIKALRQVVAGKIYLSENMASRMLQKLVDPTADTVSPVDSLSDRELEVFTLIGQGLSTRQIAEKLHLSVKTVETHRSRIKDKLHLQNASELTWHAIDWVQNQS